MRIFRTLIVAQSKVSDEGIRERIIKYVAIDGEIYIVHGSNRYLAALEARRLNELKFLKVTFPVEKTHFCTNQDVLDSSISSRQPRIKKRR